VSKNRRGGLGRGLGALIPTAPSDEPTAEGPDAPGSPLGYPPMPADDAGAERTELSGVEQVPAEPAEGAAEHPEQAGVPAQDPGAPAGGGLVGVHGATFRHIAVAEIRPNPKQPRQVFDEDALAELTHSIREFGVLQPVVVRQADGDAGGYELVMGERRLRAAANAGLDTVPAIVRTTSDDAMLRDALLENIHRAQLNPLEEAAAYQQLLAEFGATHDELAARIGRSRPQVSNTIRLLNLPVPVQRRVAAGVISAGHARALLSVEDNDVQEDLAARIVAEGLSVRATEELVALHSAGHVDKRTARRAKTPRISAPALVELAERLSNAFDTRVKVDLGRSKGKITIEFATIDDLERIVGVMSGQVAVPGEPPPNLGASLSPRPDEAAEDASAQPPAAVPDDYAGWGDDHVADLGAWDERIRYDPNES
jgi:ParB family transcriptional regulator, chromosome partitioning protein